MLGTRLAQTIYGLAARFSATLLGFSGGVESVHLHRSVATGEVVFGRSDIDLVIQLKREGHRGESLARFHQLVRGVRLLNPALTHLEVFGPGALEGYAQRDSVWCSMERRTLKRLYGPAVELPVLKIDRDDALRRFLLWWELYLPMVLQKRDSRNLEKISLECWNFFAVAEGLMEEPLLLRSQMREHLAQHRPERPDLRRPEGATRFILELVAELHSSRRPPLEGVTTYLDTLVSPHQVPRSCLILAHPQAELPARAFLPGTLIATMEALDLMIHFKNAFFRWGLPDSLELEPADRRAFLRSIHYYCAPHFLSFPGFTDPGRRNPGDRIRCLERALELLERGQDPKPPGVFTPSRLDSIDSYYREQFDPLSRRRDELEVKVLAWLD